MSYLRAKPVPVEWQPGIRKDDTDFASKGGFIGGDKVRSRRGKPQSWGGWEFATTTQFQGVARGSHSWVDLVGQELFALGTQAKLYALFGGALRDITPPHSEGVLTDAFTTLSGSKVITVAHASHALHDGDTITFSNVHAAVGGLTVSGAYTVTILTPDSYTITHASSAGSSAGPGGGSVDFVATLPAGLLDGTGGLGFGTGTYGSGYYGLPSVSDYLPRVWALQHYGEDLLALPRSGALYCWQPEIEYDNLLTNGGFATADNWATGTGWAIAAGKATKTPGAAGNLSQNAANVIGGGRMCRATFTISGRTAGTVAFKCNNGVVISVDFASTAISINGTFSRRFRAPAGITDIVFEADATFDGSIDNVSVALESVAFRIDEAPYQSDWMFTDDQRIIHLLGTVEADGDYNPMLHRWNDPGNLTTWAPDVDNLAGEQPLGVGGRLISGVATRRAVVLLSDSAMFYAPFTGNTGDVFSHQLMATGCGIIGAQALCEKDGIAFWLTASKRPYAFDGSAAIPIDCTVYEDFNHIAVSQEEKVVCDVISEFDEIIWLLPDSRDGNECSRYATFNHVEKHWSSGTLPRSSWVRSGVLPNPIACGTDGYLYFHERGETANGELLESYIIMAPWDVASGGNLMELIGCIVDYENQGGTINHTFYGRMFPNSAEVVIGPYASVSTTAKIDFRISARQVGMKISSTSPWRLGALRFYAQASGGAR